jgi:hypothetical protein
MAAPKWRGPPPRDAGSDPQTIEQRQIAFAKAKRRATHG